jgi:HAD superfamily hydrolase (TIGR01509 family)
VLLDMDGLLVDSEPSWTRAETEIVSALGGSFTPEIKAAIVGTRLDVAAPLVVRMAGLAVAPTAFAELLLTRMIELFALEIPLRPGAADLLERLRSTGVPLALVSSSHRLLVDAVIGSLGEHRFSVTVAGDEVENGKPHPEPYLTAAAGLGVPASCCLVLEDAPSGIASAEAAGCLVVGVPDSVPLEPTPWRPVLSDLGEVDLTTLRELAAARRRGAR